MGAASAAVTAGCLGDDDDDPADDDDTEPADDADDDDDPVISYWQYGGIPVEEEYFGTKYQEFTAYEVDRTHQPWGEKFSQVAAAADAGDLPHVLQVLNTLIPDYRALDAIQPLDQTDDFADRVEAMNDGIIPELVEVLQYEAGQFGVAGPFTDLGPFIDINPNYMEEAGWDEIPRTWEELLDLARDMNEIPELQAAIALPATDEELTANNFEAWAYQNGGRWFDPETGDVTIDQDGFVDALDLWGTFVEEGLTPEGQVELDYIDAGGMFMSEQVGMFVTLSHAQAILDTLEPPEQFTDGQNQIVTLAPQPESPTGEFAPVDTLIQLPKTPMMTTAAETDAEQEGAMQFMEFLMSEDFTEPWTYRDDIGIRGRLPTREDAWEDPEEIFEAQFGDLIDLYHDGELFEVAEPFPFFPGLASAQSELIRNAIQPVILGEMSAQEALSDLAPTIQDILDEEPLED